MVGYGGGDLWSAGVLNTFDKLDGLIGNWGPEKPEVQRERILKEKLEEL
jgi:hypothetical protein